MSQYHTVIGLETHAELNTKTKIFCGCRNEFGSKSNTNVCPVCLGLPGALPVLNRSVVDYAVRMGLALNCTINGVSHMDRKNYFYPDLPKAYQKAATPRSQIHRPLNIRKTMRSHSMIQKDLSSQKRRFS